MNQEIATGTFYALIVATLALQFAMCYKRSRFLRSIKVRTGQKLKGSKIEALRTMLRIVIPVKLHPGGGHLEALRKSAVRVSIYWMISLALTLIVPVIIFNLLK